MKSLDFLIYKARYTAEILGPVCFVLLSVMFLYSGALFPESIPDAFSSSEELLGQVLLLILTPGVVDWSQSWPWLKAALVIAMTAVHGLLARWRRHFANDENHHSRNFYRAMNEVPTILLIATVIVVVVKPA